MSKCSVIFSIYNMASILPIMLEAFNKQSCKNFEIIFTDDGSQDDSEQVIRSFSFRKDIQYKFVSQDDKGFRKCRILNRAIEIARTEYLIFSDGDCIPHRRFVEEHYRNRKTKTLLCGRRVLLDDNLSKRIKKNKDFSFLTLFSIFKSKSGMKYESIRLGALGAFFNLFHNKPSILGSNFSVHKDDIVAVNGFDERYEAPGTGEDNDLQLRLKNNGEHFHWIRNRAIQYHLYHIKQVVPPQNLKIYRDNEANQRTYTPYGIKQ